MTIAKIIEKAVITAIEQKEGLSIESICQHAEHDINEIIGIVNPAPTATTETFLDRLIKERDELQDKHAKLSSFLASKDKAIEISGEAQYDFMSSQLYHMAMYLQVLYARINHLQNPEPQQEGN
jgi:hypothetical protein